MNDGYINNGEKEKFKVNDFVFIDDDPTGQHMQIGLITSVVYKDGAVGYRINYSMDDDAIIYNTSIMSHVDHVYYIADMVKQLLSKINRLNPLLNPIAQEIPIYTSANKVIYYSPRFNVLDTVECNNGDLEVIRELQALPDNKYRYSVSEGLPPFMDENELKYIPTDQIKEKVSAYLLKKEKESKENERGKLNES